MKFTKEDAYKELVARMTAKGEKLNLSDRSINEQLETLITLVANEETELNDFVDKTLPLFKTADSNVRNDVSVGINKYKEDNPVQRPKQEPKVNPTTDIVDKELLARLEAMENELANSKREKQVANIRKEIVSKLKEKGVKNDEWAEALVSEITITDNFDVDAKVDSYLNLYNKMQSTVDSNVTPRSTGGGKNDYLGESIKQAAEMAKSQRLVGME